MLPSTIIAVTGHRPKDLYGTLIKIPNNVRHLYREALSPYVDRSVLVLTGMAQGVDQEVAEVCMDLHIPWWACIPFPGQERLWPESSRNYYQGLLSRATHVNYVSVRQPESPSDAARMLNSRNEWMVDNASSVIALWNGKMLGGTFNCIEYAKTRGKPVMNLWPAADYVFPAKPSIF